MVQAVSSKKRAAKFLFHHYLTECRKHLLEFSHKIVTHQTEFNQAGSIATQFLDPETTQQTKSKARFFLDASSSYWESKIKNLTAQNKAYFTRNSQFWISVHNYFRLSRRLHFKPTWKLLSGRFFCIWFSEDSKYGTRARHGLQPVTSSELTLVPLR